MLSFFRKKSTNDIAPVDGIVTAFEQMSPTSTSPRAVAVDAARVASDSGAETTMDSLELAKQLGYGSLVELKETIYGTNRASIKFRFFILMFGILVLNSRLPEND